MNFDLLIHSYVLATRKYFDNVYIEEQNLRAMNKNIPQDLLGGEVGYLCDL